MKLFVSLDGGETFDAADNVRVMVEDIDVDDDVVNLLINVSPEGVVLDVLTTDEGEEVTGTSSETMQEIVERLANH